MCPKITECVANCLDSEQMPHCAESDLGLYCLLTLVCLKILRVNTVCKARTIVQVHKNATSTHMPR